MRPGPAGRAEPDHTATSPRSCANLRSPIPSTSRSCSTRVNRPCWARQSRMRCAVTGPMPGSASSCCRVARFRSTRPAPADAGGRPRGRDPGPAGPDRSAPRGRLRRLRHPYRELLAVGHLAGQVEPEQVGTRKRTAGDRRARPRPGRRPAPGRVLASRPCRPRSRPASWAPPASGAPIAPDAVGPLIAADPAGGTSASGGAGSATGRSNQTPTAASTAADAVTRASASAPRRPGSSRAVRSRPGTQVSSNRCNHDGGSRTSGNGTVLGFQPDRQAQRESRRPRRGPPAGSTVTGRHAAARPTQALRRPAGRSPAPIRRGPMSGVARQRGDPVPGRPRLVLHAARHAVDARSAECPKPALRRHCGQPDADVDNQAAGAALPQPDRRRGMQRCRHLPGAG